MSKRKPVVTDISVRVNLSNGAWIDWNGKLACGQYIKDNIDCQAVDEAWQMIKDKLQEEAVL